MRETERRTRFVNSICEAVGHVNVKILDKSDKHVSFMLEDANAAVANCLRRIMMSGIPAMAIDRVDINQNTSGLFDEVIAHRLGLIPLTFDDEVYSVPADCKCNGKGCSKCEVVLVLEKTGPCLVTAADLKSTDESVKPVEMDIPITELYDGQELKLEATARLGFGREHAKWQAANAGYRYAPSVRLKDKSELPQALLKVCPKSIFIQKGKEITTQNTSDCILCMECAELTDAVSVSGNPNSFIFTVETVSGLSASDIVRKSVSALERQADEFEEDFKKSTK